MSKKKKYTRFIEISKYEGNTHYSASVYDSYGQEHHLGYYNELGINVDSIQKKAEKIWSNETERKVDLLDKAIKEMIDIGKKYTDNRGNYRDGLD
tara:strand:+ start:42 stop:326 length:285 start_codon:yes stop_codon:yes gene_type:complete